MVLHGGTEERKIDMSEVSKVDVDALETQEWLEALESVVRTEGVERAQFLFETVL